MDLIYFIVVISVSIHHTSSNNARWKEFVLITPELQKYIADSRTNGMSDEHIKATLLSQGWKEQDLSAVLKPSPLLKRIIILNIFLIPVILFFFVFTGAFVADTKAGLPLSFIMIGMGVLFPLLAIALSIVSWKKKSNRPLKILDMVYGAFIMGLLLVGTIF